MRGWLTRVVRAALVVAPLVAAAACQSLIRPAGGNCGGGVDGDDMVGPNCPGHVPAVCKDPTVMALAHDLDHLEKHIDWYGSAVAKVPDVWGQARLTQYREEFEKQMAYELDRFQFGINGSISRSDQAFFASATALSFAVQPPAPVIGRVSSDKNAVPNLVPLVTTGQTTKQVVTDPKAGTVTTTDTTLGPLQSPPPPPAPPAPTPVKPLDVADPASLIENPNITRNPAVLAARLPFQGGTAIMIEPAEYLAQKKRYLDFLNQLRRENEGDDTADSPGYSLNLMRVPVSVLPGKKTDVGYGCEVTMTLTPILGEDLLPVTFRNLVINDLIDHIGWPLTHFLDQQDVQQGQFLTEENRQLLQGLELLDRVEKCATADARLKYVNQLSDPDRRRLCTAIKLADPPGCWVVPFQPTDVTKDPKCKDDNETAHCQQLIAHYICHRMINFPDLTIACPPAGGHSQPGTPGSGQPSRPPTEPTRSQTERMLKTVTDRFRAGSSGTRSLKTPDTPAVPFSNGLLARQPFPTSELLEVYGVGNAFEIAFGAYTAFKDEIKTTTYVHLPNIQMYLREELNAAYELLNAYPDLWATFCTPDLAHAVKGRRLGYLDDRRAQYRAMVEHLTLTDLTRQIKPRFELIHLSKTAALGWCILVESALLTDRLVQDMKELATSRQVVLPLAGQWLPYFLPSPPPEARRAFNDYAKVRWPIHVFALDPYVQEQNIADSLSTRREMQLALSIAFTNGQINARQLTRFTRRLEGEFEAIDLNRTQIGFSHGENVFGWRFYPRYQTPDTESNFTVLFRDMFVGGPNRNALLRQRRLEPGMRECVAVVMMPSFVPYLHLDTVSNWFPLPNPKHKSLDTAQAMRLSRTVQTIKTCGPGVTDAQCYRDGEFERLLRRAEQLEARLPTQTLTVQVPLLNTLGGFEMFNHGVADLAPELFGFYGAPGIAPDKDTTLFLVGDHFSPLRSRVIVGNQEITADRQTMLSRQVMQVRVPGNTLPVKYPDGTSYARIHVATPYGVSTEIEVPIVVKPDPKPGFAFGSAKLTANYGMVITDSAKTFVPIPKGAGTDDLKITWTTPAGTLSEYVAIDLEFEFTPPAAAKPVTLKVPCRGCVVGGTTAKEIVIPQPVKDAIAADLIAQIAALGPFPITPNPLDAGLKTKTVTITPLTPPGVIAQKATTNDALKVEFKAEGVCPPPAGHPRFGPHPLLRVMPPGPHPEPFLPGPPLTPVMPPGPTPPAAPPPKE
jgi:hypothetical protein